MTAVTAMKLKCYARPAMKFLGRPTLEVKFGRRPRPALGPPKCGSAYNSTHATTCTQKDGVVASAAWPAERGHATRVSATQQPTPTHPAVHERRRPYPR